MKKFLAVFIGSETSPNILRWEALSETDRKAKEQAGMKGWQEWMIKNQAVIKDQGAPLGETKSTTPDGVSDITNSLCGYVIVEAESHEEAAKLFLNHPHFSIFPGDGVEIMECLPIPGSKQ